MTREQYMLELDRLLSAVPQPQRSEWLYDYEMHFHMASQNGVPEEEAARQLGDPRAIASELLLSYRVTQAESRSNVVSVSRAVFATISLGFINLIFILGPFIAVMGILIAFWAVSGALVVSAAAAMLEGWRGEALTLLQAGSLAAVLGGLGMILGAATLYMTRKFFELTIRYLKFNTRIVRGESR